MINNFTQSRRAVIQSSVFGLMAASIPNIGFAQQIKALPDSEDFVDKIFHRYPSIDDELVNEVVGASHFNFDRVK